MTHNTNRKVAVINDISGFGRCSMTVELPIISAMGIQCCPLPTAIFSNHTAYDSYFFEDYTDKMKPYYKEWEKLELSFAGICTGFLGSATQIAIVEDFFRIFRDSGTLVVVDPIMADGGVPYATYTPQMCARIKQLVLHADIITPNVTEACILTNTPYTEDMTIEDMKKMIPLLHDLGPQKVVITGVERKSDNGTMIGNIVSEKGYSSVYTQMPMLGPSRAGTGDVFSAIIFGAAIKKMDFLSSVMMAERFIFRCVKRAEELRIPVEDGICFEEFLSYLTSSNT